MSTRALNIAVRLGLCLMLTFMSVLGRPALAQTSKAWTTVAAAGTVDDDNLDKVSMATNGVAQLNAGADLAIIRYNVVATDGLFDNLAFPRMRVRFMDGGANAQVLVSLYQVDLNTGVHTKLLELDSNDYAGGTEFQTQTTAGCAAENVVFDFTNRAYYVEARLSRSNHLGLAKLSSIQIFKQQSQCS